MLEQWIHTYGYWALLLGTFLEGETILLIAGFVASQGGLWLPLVMLTAWVGSFTGDQFFFYLGRYKGRELLQKVKPWRERSARVHELIDKYDTLIMLGVRFMYGLRIVTPLVLGSSPINAGRFFFLNALGAVLWAVLVPSAGYMFGSALNFTLGDVERYKYWVVLALFLVSSSVGLVMWLYKRWINR